MKVVLGKYYPPTQVTGKTNKNPFWGWDEVLGIMQFTLKCHKTPFKKVNVPWMKTSRDNSCRNKPTEMRYWQC